MERRPHEAVDESRRIRLTAGVVVVIDPAAGLGADAINVRVLAGHAQSDQPPRAAGNLDEPHAEAVGHRDRLETSGPRADERVVVGNLDAPSAARGQRMHGLVARPRGPERHLVHERKDGGRCRDADSQRQDGDGRK
jgi:hypothetical protein